MIKMVHKKLAAWTACLAILVAALAPSILHAITSQQDVPADSVLICTSSGYQWVNLLTGERRDAGANVGTTGEAGTTQNKHLDKSSHLERCEFCGSHGHTLGLVPSDYLSDPEIASGNLAPSLFHHAPRPLFAWSSSRSRAPPVLS